jgi:hypothetical protein
MKLFTAYYNQLLQELYPLYPTSAQIQSVMYNVGLEPGEANINGAAIDSWTSVLNLAENKDKLIELIKYVINQFPTHSAFAEVLRHISDGIAVIPLKDYRNYNDKSSSPKALKTFLVYDEEDSAMVRSLRLQLYPLQRFKGKISIFDMQTAPTGGIDKEQFLLKNIGDSRIVLLLLTKSFIGNPDNLCDILMFASLEMGKCVIPVLLKDCLWNRVEPLIKIVPLPKNREFVSNWSSFDNALLKIAEGVEEIADAGNC